jgi:hypothetical protein
MIWTVIGKAVGELHELTINAAHDNPKRLLTSENLST